MSGTDRSDGLFEFGGLAVLAWVILALFALAYALPILEPTALFYVSHYLLEAALLPIVTLALFRASRRQTSKERSAFFLRLGVAFLAWAVVAVLRWPLEQAFGARVEDLVRDVLYCVYYVAFLSAIEWAPAQRERSRPERVVAFAGSLVLVVGSLLYIRVIPALALPSSEAVPYLVLYLALDVYIAVRLAMLLPRQNPPQRLVFGLLTATGLGIALSDALELAHAFDMVSYSDTSLLNLAWLLPYASLVLAVNVRGLEHAGTGPERSSIQVSSSVASLWSPLIAYGVALPVVHITLYASGAGSPAAERPRAYFVLAWLAVLTFLIFLQRAMVGVHVLSSERALRESYLQIRELTGARETAVEAERKRLARELRDGLGQRLVQLQLDLAWLGARNGGGAPLLKQRLEAASGLTFDALESAKRIAAGLRPRTLDEQGLSAALQELVGVTAANGGLDIRLLSDDDEVRLTPDEEIALYRIAQESLTNCVKHAEASRIEVVLSSRDDRAELEVRDDGRGIPEGADADRSGLGLFSIEERVRAVGGELAIGTGIDGRGFSVRATLARSLPDSRHGGGEEIASPGL